MVKIEHKFCVDVFFTSHTLPDLWITNVIVPLTKERSLSLMTKKYHIDVNS